MHLHFASIQTKIGEKRASNGVSFSNLAKNHLVIDPVVQKSLEIKKNVSRSHSNTRPEPKPSIFLQIPPSAKQSQQSIEAISNKKNQNSGQFFSGLGPEVTNSSSISRSSVKSQPVPNVNQHYMPVFMNGPPFGFSGPSGNFQYQPNLHPNGQVPSPNSANFLLLNIWQTAHDVYDGLRSNGESIQLPSHAKEF